MKPTPKTVRLFDDQPRLTNADIERLTNAGLLVPDKTPRVRVNNYRTVKGLVVEDEVTNLTAGQVVGHTPLCAKLKDGLVSPDDAKRLMAIETCRENGPRQSHVERLLNVALRANRNAVMAKIEETAKKIRNA